MLEYDLLRDVCNMLLIASVSPFMVLFFFFSFRFHFLIMMPGLSSALFVMPFIIYNYLHTIVIVGFWTKFPVCEWQVGSLYTNKLWHQLHVQCFNSDTVYPEVTSNFRLRTQSHKTMPHTPHFQSQPQVQVTTCTSGWQVIDGRLQQLPLCVCLICSSGSQNSEKLFTY